MTHRKLAIANNFLFSIDNDEECVMHSKSDNVEIMMNDKADEIKEELLGSLKGTLPGLRQFLVIESHLKMMKNAHLKSSFCSQDI